MPHYVEVVQFAYSIALHRDCWMRLTYKLDWDPDARELREFLVSQTIIAAPSAAQFQPIGG